MLVNFLLSNINKFRSILESKESYYIEIPDMKGSSDHYRQTIAKNSVEHNTTMNNHSELQATTP